MKKIITFSKTHPSLFIPLLLPLCFLIINHTPTLSLFLFCAWIVLFVCAYFLKDFINNITFKPTPLNLTLISFAFISIILALFLLLQNFNT